MSFCPPDGCVRRIVVTAREVFEGPGGDSRPHCRLGGCSRTLSFEPEDVQDLGNGVTFSVLRDDGRPAGSTGHVETRQAYVLEWVEGMVARATVYSDIDEARAAAERLAEERG